jgi:hypothetical protein
MVNSFCHGGRGQGGGQSCSQHEAAPFNCAARIKYNKFVSQHYCCDNIMSYGFQRHSQDHRERAEMLRQMLDLLTSDGYLVRQDDAVRFRYALLRRYWREVQG